MNRPRVLAVLPGVFPSAVINVAGPLLRLHEAGSIDLELSFQFLVRRRQIEQAGVLVMCHTIDPAYVWMLDCARECGRPLLYDLDENVFEPPSNVPGLDFHRAPERQAAVRRCLDQAVLVRTYSPALKRYLDRFNPEVVLVDGPVDWSLIRPRTSGRASAGPSSRRPWRPALERFRYPCSGRPSGRPSDLRTWGPASAGPCAPSNVVRIVYATSRTEDAIGLSLMPPLRRILAEHPSVEVTIWGPRSTGLGDHPRARHRELVPHYDRYLEQFAAAGFDIGLAPLPVDLWHQSKTATKFRDYAACRVAGIYADTEVYRDCVVDGETGLLVPPTEEAWFQAMSRLILDASLRRQIQDRAEAYACDRYGPGRVERTWLDQVEQVARPVLESVVHGGVHSGDRAPAPSPSVAIIAGGILRQIVRYARRVPHALRSRGARDVWRRTRGQLAGYRQLMAWNMALRRRQR